MRQQGVNEPYPRRTSERDRWIVARRPVRDQADPARPYAFFSEKERAESGEVASVATILLTSRECPWRCVMCDLWKHTLTGAVPPGAIPAQIDHALRRLPAASQVKLYNSGSFFDPHAIPPQDYPRIARLVQGFERVIVECHPALVGAPALRFRDMLTAKLEVAMGLETAHPEALDRLNKRMTLGQFSRAAAFLRRHSIALRVFILVKPPFQNEQKAVHWAKQSIDFAFDNGAAVVSLIPTRLGNGALEALAERGEFAPPRLTSLEETLEYGVGLRRGRVFADLWDLEKFSECDACFTARRERLRQINHSQTVPAPLRCTACAHAT